jgi:hypothetical protein
MQICNNEQVEFQYLNYKWFPYKESFSPDIAIALRSMHQECEWLHMTLASGQLVLKV